MEEDAYNERDAGPSDPMTGVVKSADLPAILAKQKQLIANEEKMHAFFDSPEKSIRIFMSSYARAMGYIWYINTVSPDFFLLTFFFVSLGPTSTLNACLAFLRSSSSSYCAAKSSLKSTVNCAAPWRSSQSPKKSSQICLRWPSPRPISSVSAS